MKVAGLARAGAIGALGLLLAGCASVPTSGGIHQETQAKGANDQAQGGVQFYPEPPEDGATPEEIVKGFLDASGAVEPAAEGVPSLATARKYLAPWTRMKWNPRRVIVFNDIDAQYDPGRDGNSVIFKAELDGKVIDGAYVSATEPYNHRFEVPVTGAADGPRERRIANPPPGELLISKTNFDREFASLNLYFLDPTQPMPTQRVLVPDPVYLPNRADRATLLVQRLLDGPTPWLASAVRSAFPPGTALTKRGVRIEGGQASVDLTAPAAKAPTDQQALFARQLVWTLVQLPISSVTITAEGRPLGLPTAMTVNDVTDVRPAEGGGESYAYALRDGQLHVFQGFGTSEEKPPEKVTVEFGRQRKLAEFAVQPNTVRGTTATIAGIDQARKKLYVAESTLPPREVFSGSMLSSPTWDRFGWLWVLDKTAGKIMAEYSPKRERFRVSAPWLDAGSLRVDAIAVSQDGTRLAMVTVDPAGRRHAQVAAILHDGDTPRLGEPHDLAPGLSARDIAWRGADELVVLAVDTGQPQVYTVSVDGSQLKSQGSVEGSQSVTAAPDRPILVGTANALWEQSSLGSWEKIEDKMTAPRYPG